VDHDSANEKGFYSCIDSMLSLKNKIIKANKELFILLDRPEQTLDVKERIKLLMSQLNTYKVITIIYFIFLFNALICSIMILCSLTFTLSHKKKKIFFIKEYLEPVQPGVGSSGATETLQSPDTSGHTTARALFTSPSSTPHADRIHDMHRHASTPRSEFREGGRDEDHSDVVEMDAFPGARHVTSMRTLSCTFLVDNNGLPLKQSRLLSSFKSYFNHLMLSSYINRLDY
jgi:hypothetical protein